MRRFQQSRHALGSTAYITVVLEGDGPAPDSLFQTLWGEVEVFEQRFSRFLPDSELSRFNAAAGKRQSVSGDFQKLLTAAKDFAGKTHGMYNPCILPALQRAGYKGSWPRPQASESSLNYEHRAVADWQNMRIGGGWAEIPADAAIDFGGIGKGYLLDRLAETLESKSIGNYWASLGGDILCAGRDATGDSWRVGIQDAYDEGKAVASVANGEGKLAIATSGTTKRQGVSDNGPWHHIIDPRTGGPAETDILTATVCAGGATVADVAAKCLVIAGSREAEAMLTALGEKNALLQIRSGTKSDTLKIGSVWSA